MAITNPLLAKLNQGKTGGTFGGVVTAAHPATQMASGAPAGDRYAPQGKPATTPLTQGPNAQTRTMFGLPPAPPPAAKPPVATQPQGWGSTFQNLVQQHAGGTPTAPAGTGGPMVPQAGGTQPGGTQTLGGNWGAGATPNWTTFGTDVPLYGQWYANGKNWGVQPRLNMAYARATGYTGGFGGGAGDTWLAFYNNLSPQMKATVNSIRASYPQQTVPAGPGNQPGTQTAIQQAKNPPVGPGGGAQTAGGGGAGGGGGGGGTGGGGGGTGGGGGGTGGGGGGTGGGGTTLTSGWERTGAPAAGGATPGGVSYVMPTFNQAGGQFQGYSPASAQWGSTANMQTYYPGR